MKKVREREKHGTHRLLLLLLGDSYTKLWLHRYEAYMEGMRPPSSNASIVHALTSGTQSGAELVDQLARLHE